MNLKQKAMIPVIWYKKMYLERKKTTIVITALLTIVIVSLLSYDYLKNKAYEGNIKLQLDAGIKSGKIISYNDVSCHTNITTNTTCNVDLLKINSTNAQTQENQILSIKNVSIVNVESATVIPIMIKGDFKAGETNNLNGEIILTDIRVNNEKILWNKQNEQNIIEAYGEKSSEDLRKYLKQSFNEESNLVLKYKSQLNDQKNVELMLSATAEVGNQYSIGLNTNIKLDKSFSDNAKILQESTDFEEITKAKMSLLEKTTLTSIGFKLYSKNDKFFKELIFKVYESNIKNNPDNAKQLTAELAGDDIANKYSVLTREQFESIALPNMESKIKTSLSESVIVQNMSKEGQKSLNTKIENIVKGESASFTINVVNKKQLSMGEIPQKVMMGYISKDPAVFINLFNITIK